MGRRSRKRATGEGHGPAGGASHTAEAAGGSTRAERDAARRRRAQAAASSSPGSSRRSDRRGERPPAPWGSFPLAELCVLVALVLGIAGAIVWGPRGRVMIVCAAAIGSLAGLELAIREHLAGYRSHTQILAATPAVVVLAALYFLSPLPSGVVVAVGVVVFVSAFFLLRDLFKRRSGGLSFR